MDPYVIPSNVAVSILSSMPAFLTSHAACSYETDALDTSQGTVGISFGASRELAFRHAKTGELSHSQRLRRWLGESVWMSGTSVWYQAPCLSPMMFSMGS